jgi:hypothetical protein
MVLADLARCFAERGRNVAAIACLDEARQLGIEGPEAETLRSQVLEALGEPYERFRRYMDG